MHPAQLIDNRPCWRCHWYAGMDSGAALCLNRSCCAIRAMPENGCSAWERAIDCEDVQPPARPWRPITMLERRAFLGRRGEKLNGP